MIKMGMCHNNSCWLAAFAENLSYQISHLPSGRLQTGINHNPTCCFFVLDKVYVHENIFKPPNTGSNQPCVRSEASFFGGSVFPTVYFRSVHSFILVDSQQITYHGKIIKSAKMYAH